MAIMTSVDVSGPDAVVVRESGCAKQSVHGRRDFCGNVCRFRGN